MIVQTYIPPLNLGPSYISFYNNLTPQSQIRSTQIQPWEEPTAHAELVPKEKKIYTQPVANLNAGWLDRSNQTLELFYKNKIAQAKALLFNAEANHMPEEAINRLLELGSLFMSIGSLKKAKEYLTETLNRCGICSGGFIDPRMLKCCNDLGHVCTKQGDHDGARIYYRMALEMLLPGIFTNRDLELAEGYFYLGGAEQALGNLDEAIEAYKNALTIYRNERTHRATQLFRKQKSKETSSRAVIGVSDNPTMRQVRSTLAKPLTMAKIHSALGQVYLECDDLSDAKNHLEKALQIYIEQYETENHPDVADCCFHIARTLLELDYTKGAVQMFDNARRIYTNVHQTECRPEVAECYRYLGDAQQMLQEYEQARAYYFKALDIYRITLGKKYDALLRESILSCNDIIPRPFEPPLSQKLMAVLYN